MANIIKFFGGFAFFLLATIHVVAQNPNIKPSIINLGEVASSITSVATLHNTTDKPLLITKISSDCHCTKINYSRRPIIKGDSSLITVTYTPTAPDGVFYKSILVQTSASNEPIKFIIRGTNI